jgi:transcription antitermination factor NusG
MKNTRDIKTNQMQWYVVITKPRAERKVAERLERLGVEVFCPVITERRQWSDRVKNVEVSLLPSMVLVRIENDQRNRVFDVSGVLRYLFYLGQPAKVRNEEIAVLKDIQKNGNSVLEFKTIGPGDLIDVPGFNTTTQKGKVSHVSGNKCWVVLEQLGFVVVVQL